MIATPELIEALAASAAPVRRLRPPLVRAALWLLFAALILALLGVSHGLRPDLAARVEQTAFLLALAAAGLTGVLAAIAAFVVSLPDRSCRWVLLPLPALALWLSTIGYGCLTHWVVIGPHGVRLGETARCFATLVLTGAPLSFVMLFMLRHAAIIRARLTASLASLAVAAFTATALSLFHELHATVMILVWNGATTALIVALGSALARRMFSWAGLPAAAAHGLSA